MAKKGIDPKDFKDIYQQEILMIGLEHNYSIYDYGSVKDTFTTSAKKDDIVSYQLLSPTLLIESISGEGPTRLVRNTYNLLYNFKEKKVINQGTFPNTAEYIFSTRFIYISNNEIILVIQGKNYLWTIDTNDIKELIGSYEIKLVHPLNKRKVIIVYEKEIRREKKIFISVYDIDKQKKQDILDITDIASHRIPQFVRIYDDEIALINSGITINSSLTIIKFISDNEIKIVKKIDDLTRIDTDNVNWRIGYRRYENIIKISKDRYIIEKNIVERDGGSREFTTLLLTVGTQGDTLHRFQFPDIEEKTNISNLGVFNSPLTQRFLISPSQDTKDKILLIVNYEDVYVDQNGFARIKKYKSIQLPRFTESNSRTQFLTSWNREKIKKLVLIYVQYLKDNYLSKDLANVVGKFLL